MGRLYEEHESRLRRALRGLALDARDERVVRHYAKVWDDDTVEVITGWIERARWAGTTKSAPPPEGDGASGRSATP